MAKTTVRKEPTESVMSFGEHLEELRSRVILAIVVPIPVMILAYFVSDTLLRWLLLPVTDALRDHGLPAQLQILGPAEFLIAQLKISVIAGLVVSFPWILWQMWLFIRPGLYAHERRFVYLLLPGSFILSLAGIALMYFAMLPLMLQVLVGMGQSMGGPDLDPRVADVLETGATVHVFLGDVPPESAVIGEAWMSWPGQELYIVVPDEDGAAMPLWAPRSFIAQQFQVSATVNFVLLLFVAILIAFQLPLVMMLLGWVGIVSPQWLRKQRKYAVVLLAVVSAVITPPDVFSMMMMMIPLYGLYELGILLMVFVPASRIAEGRVLGRSSQRARDWAADKKSNAPDHLRKPAQPESTVPRQTGNSAETEQSTDSTTDGENHSR